MKKITYKITLIALVFLTSCSEKAKKTTAVKAAETVEEHNNTEVTKTQFETAGMVLGKFTEQNFPVTVQASGMIDVPPQSKQIVTSFYGGTVKKSNLLIGDVVRKGQALVTIENPEFVDMQQEYLEIKEQLDYLKNEYERQKTLFDEKITSQKKYLKAKSDYQRQLARYKGLAKKLTMLNISTSSVEQGNITSQITLYAAISGSVTKVNVSKGTQVSPSDEIIEIINTDHIHVELTVFEKDAMKIKKGQVIRFKIPEASDDYFEAEVHLVGKTIDEKTRTVKVHGHLHKETKNNFNIGMFVSAFIEISNEKSIALPSDAVLEEGEGNIVFQLEKQENDHYIFEEIEVKAGKTYNGYTQILSKDLDKEKLILVKNAYALAGSAGGGYSH